ncbi:MAG TPA: hypothetical protein VGH88_07770 [Streptosporangiaceae bacterium]
MLGEIVLAAVLAAGCVAGTWRWIRLARASARATAAPAGAGEPDGLFRGGIMARHILTSGTLVRLEMFDWGVRLRGTATFRWIIPTWEARYDELAIAELVSLPASRICVWLRPRGGSHAIGFLSGDSQEILARLQDQGVPVNRAVTRVRRVAELYP